MIRNPLLIAMLTMVAVTTTVQAKGRVTGQVVDVAGKGVNDLTLRFTALDEQTAAWTVEVKKKGRFFSSGTPRGQYRIELVGSELFIKHVEFSVWREDGLSIGAGELEGHPRDGAAAVPLSDRDEVRLTVTVAPKAAAGEGKLVLLSPEVAAAAALYNRGEYGETVTEARRVLANRPSSGETAYVLGLALEKLGEHAEAESFLGAALEAMPDTPRLHAALAEASLNLAVEHEAAGDTAAASQAYARAAVALTAAIEEDPDALSLRINLAAALDRSGSDDRLAGVLEDVVERDASHLQSRLRLASLYTRDGRHEEAIALLGDIPETEKRAAVTIYNVAAGMNADGDIEGSLLIARRAAEIDPQLPEPKQLIAQILLGKDDRPAAIEAIRQFLEVAPDDANTETYRRILQQLE